jgi:hypothetical protein
MRKINPSARVILTSGYDGQESINRFEGMGLAGFVNKPYRLAELMAKELDAKNVVKEFYLGLSTSGRKSFRDSKHYRRRKRWLA